MHQIHIILSHTQHPGNIGSAARALKNMGLSNLSLINPCDFSADSGMAKAMAAGADDILRNAKVTASLEAAVADCHLLIGTSTRDRGVQWPLLSARQAAEKIFCEIQAGVPSVGILFGCESFGLSNEALQCCHYHLKIPANPEYSSLNLAAAVQVVSYEIRMAFLENLKPLADDNNSVVNVPNESASMADLEGFYQHLTEVLYQIKFINPKQPRKILQRLRKIYNRTNLDKVEINILRGILTETQRMLGESE